MKLTRLTTRALAGVPDLDVTAPTAPGCPWVFTGSLASGKTRVLDAIVTLKEHAGPYGTPAAHDGWARSPSAVAVAEWFVSQESFRQEWRPAEASPTVTDPSPKVRRAFSAWVAGSEPKVELLHASRLFDLLQPMDPEAPLPSPTRSALRVARKAGKYDWVRAWLTKRAGRAAERTMTALAEQGLALGAPVAAEDAGFRNRLAALTDQLRFVRCGLTAPWPIWFARRDGREIELAHVSDGEKALVLFAAAYEALVLDRAMVLIDQVEQHLHPEEHARVVETLSHWSRDGQLILTTSSPAVLRSVPSAAVVVLR